MEEYYKTMENLVANFYYSCQYQGKIYFIFSLYAQEQYNEKRLGVIDIKNQKFMEIDGFKEVEQNICNFLVYRGWVFIQLDNAQIRMFNLLTKEFQMLTWLMHFQQSSSKLIINNQGKLLIVIQASETLKKGMAHFTIMLKSLKRIGDITPVEGLYNNSDHFSQQHDAVNYVTGQEYSAICIDNQNGIYLYLAHQYYIELLLFGEILRTQKLDKKESRFIPTAISQVEILETIKKYRLILFEGQAFESNLILVSGMGLLKFQ
ncbi:UNKNOWN [Stylonychia lemnae]|uniref:Uncharacterized protein n=1 Tax=Stylonychia lemnae TaxID=5949 RepID=A0A078B6K4_STYLE|nr:UNKNOWN [Stylonychia lemnae]|eukprot:CDW88907.1 UNKNOWN [Stylonychia lemnae]